jgi:hypothetical protein
VSAAAVPVWKRVTAFLIFTAVGPLAGFAVLLLMTLYIGGWSFAADPELVGAFLGISFLTSFAFFIALVEAALTGLVAAFSFTQRQLIRFWPVVAAGALIAAILLLVSGLSDPIDRWVAAGYVAIHAGSALLCYLLTNLALWPFRIAKNESA